MNIIERLAKAVEQEPSSEIEGICRYTVAAEMRRAKRMLTADEIEDVVDDVVTEESIADLSADALDENGEVNVSDLERANIPEDEIVTVGEGEEEVEGVVVEGRFAKLNVRPDTSRRTLSASIAKHCEMLAHMANVNEGIDLRSLYRPVPDVTMPCPRCASRNVTPVWYDQGQVTAMCNHCGGEFDASVDDVAHATLAERTVEDIDILPEYGVFGSVWLKGAGYGFEVYAEGELVDSGEADTFDEVQERFDDIADAYDEIGEGTELDFTNGKSETVDEVEGDELVFESGRKASRCRVARMSVDGKAFIRNAGRLHVQAGQVYESMNGSVVVDSVGRDGIYATVIEGTPDGRVSERVARFTEGQFAKLFRKGGYLA